jgi:hypothetical protein
MKTFRAILLLIGLCATIIGCQEEIVTPISGDVIGFIKLLDEKGNEIADRSNVRVRLDAHHSVLTDANGKFKYQGLESGTYHVSFEKEGFGTYKRFNFVFVGGNRPAVFYNIHLVKLPSLEVKTFEVKALGNFQLEVSGTMTPTDNYYFTYFFSKDPMVSNIHYESSYGYSACCFPMTAFDNYFILSSTNFSVGQKIYVSSYVVNTANQYGLYNYYDYEINHYVNPAMKQVIEPVEIILQ